MCCYTCDQLPLQWEICVHNKWTPRLMRHLYWITCGLFGSPKYYFITKANEILCFPMDHWLVSYHPLRQLQKDDCVGTNSKATKWGSSRVTNLSVLLLQTRKYERDTARGVDPLGARGAGVGAESPLPLTASSPDTNNAEPMPCKVSPPGLSSSSLPDTGTNNMLSMMNMTCSSVSESCLRWVVIFFKAMPILQSCDARYNGG